MCVNKGCGGGALFGRYQHTSTKKKFANTTAHSKGQAVGAFNVYNLEGIRAVAMAARATGASALLQVGDFAFWVGNGVRIHMLKRLLIMSKCCGCVRCRPPPFWHHVSINQ